MSRYYGTVRVTLSGWFDADGMEEIIEDPLYCASNVTIETENVDVREEEFIGNCEYCGNAIYDGDCGVKDADGRIYCDEYCLQEMKKELAKEESDGEDDEQPQTES